MSTMGGEDVTVQRERRLGAVVISLIIVAFSLIAGSIGFAGSVLTAAIWYRWGTPSAIAGGTVALFTLHAVNESIVILVGTVFTALIFTDAIQLTRSTRVLVVAVSSPLVFGALAWSTLQWGPLWASGVVVLLALALTAYTLHRLCLVRLGLVADSSQSTEPTTPLDHQ